MSSDAGHRVVLVTAPDLETARTVARAALESRLVACANLIPGLESHYWWQGRIESAAEVLIVFKTVESRIGELERVVQSVHPYETPEFLVLPVGGGSARYLEWISASVEAAGPASAR